MKAVVIVVRFTIEPLLIRGGGQMSKSEEYDAKQVRR